MAQPNKYSTERAVFPRDKPSVLGLWRGNLGDPARLDAKFEWFYERSPVGEPLTTLLYCRDTGEPAPAEPIGVAAAGPRPFLLGDEPLASAVLVDMTVSPQHRSLFPALTLQKALLQAGLADRELLYGFPNAKAAPVFQRAGYRKLGAITRYVRITRAAPYLRGRVPGWSATPAGALLDLTTRVRFGSGRVRSPRCELRWCDLSEARATHDFTSVAGRSLLRGARSDAFLQWRFAGRRAPRHRFVAVHVGGGAAPAGYWVTEGAGDVLHVRDCSASLLTGSFARAAWTRLFDEVRRRGIRSVSFECLAPAEFSATLHAVGMTARSERPVFGAFRPDFEARAAAAAWYLTDADEDE